MHDGEMVGAVLVAAGRSTRMGFDKLWADLNGRPVLAWSLDTAAPLHLGACEDIERSVAALLPGGGQAGQRVWVDQAAVIAP